MPNTVAFDIETTGLDARRDRITVVCLYGAVGAHAGDTHTESAESANESAHETDEQSKCGVTLNFMRDMDANGRYNRELIQRFVAILDAAECITTFNGIRFDYAFVQNQFGIHADVIGAWIFKTFDIYHICSNMFNCTFKLNTLLSENGIECKSASGLQAVEWAKNPQTWPLLESYCLDDTRLTYIVSQLPIIRIPKLTHTLSLVGPTAF